MIEERDPLTRRNRLLMKCLRQLSADLAALEERVAALEARESRQTRLAAEHKGLVSELLKGTGTSLVTPEGTLSWDRAMELLEEGRLE